MVTFLSTSHPIVRVVVSVVMEGGAVGSTTGRTELIMKSGGH